MTNLRIAYATAVLLATPIGAAIVPPPPPPVCVLDGATGLPMPQGGRGVCASSTGDRRVLVQRSDEGLLIAWPDAGAWSDEQGAGGSRNVDIREARSRVVFCPSSLLDFATGAPGSDCLAATSPVSPGPGAFVGAGTVRASLVVDATGRTLCPTAARVAASVTSSAGARFELTSSIVALEMSGKPETCSRAYDRIELAYGGSASRAAHAAAPRTQAADAQRMDRLMRLDDEQWRVVDLLLALTPQDLRTVEALVSIDANAQRNTPIEPAALIDVVNTILDRVNSIRTTLSSVSGRIPDRADVRALLGQIDLARVRDISGEVRDTLQGLLDVARELREGFETFNVAAFRIRLGGVLTDLEAASSLTQRLLCVDDPTLTIREISTAPIRRLLDRAPAIVLYGLSRVLEGVDPEWDQRLGSIVDAVPPALVGLCAGGARPALAPQLDVENTICSILRPKVAGASLGGVKVAVSVALAIVRFVKNNTKEEIQATVGVTAVAGGTAGTSVKNPAHAALELWVDRLDNLKDLLKDLLDRRKDCLDADKDIESDLRDCAKDFCNCSVPLSVVLEGTVQPSYLYVSDLVAVRIGLAESAGLPRVADARAKYEQAIDATHDGTAEGYGLLCQAYRLLLPSTGIGHEPPIVVDTR